MSSTFVFGAFISIVLFCFSIFICPAEKLRSNFISAFLAVAALAATTVLVNHYTTNDIVGIFAGTIAYNAVIAVSWMVSVAFELRNMH